MELGVSRQDRGGAAVLEVSGMLDIATVRPLRAALEEALDGAPPRLLVDLSALSFIDSTGCRELVRAAKRGRRTGSAVELVIPPDNAPVRRVVELMHFGTLLPVHPQMPA